MHNGRMHSSQRRRPSTLAVVVALLTVYIVWGSTYLGIAVMIETMPPLLAAGVRYLLAGLILLVAVVVHARLRGGRLEPMTRPQWRAAFVIGAFLLLGGNGGVVLGELFIPSGVAAVLIATTPIWMSLFDAVVRRRRPSRLVVAGLLAGLLGVAVMLVPVEGIGQLDPIGVALVLAAAILWAVGSVHAQSAPRPGNALLGSAMTMVGGGIALLVAGVVVGEAARIDLAAISMRSLAAFWYLVFAGSLAGFTAYSWLLSNASVSVVGTYAYVNPVVAVILGAIILSEPITPRTMLAAAVIIGAVVAMVSGRPRETEEPGPGPEAAPLEAREVQGPSSPEAV